MKIHTFSLLFFFCNTVLADAEFSQFNINKTFIDKNNKETPNPGYGSPSYIDSINNKAIVNFSQNTQFPVMFEASCPEGPDGKPAIQNHFTMTKQNGDQTITYAKHVSTGSTCEEQKQKDPAVTDCVAQSAMSILFKSVSSDDAKKNQGSICESSPCEVTLKSKDKDGKEFCPNTSLVALVDSKNHGLSSDLRDKSHCTLPQKALSAAGAIWDDPSFPYSHISTAPNGIFVGDHTYFYFDERQGNIDKKTGKPSGQFCIYFHPKNKNASSVCRDDFSGRSFPLDFIRGGRRENHGVVTLSRDAKSGNISMLVGTSTNPNAQSQTNKPLTHSVDTNKPYLNMTINSSAQNGRSIQYSMMADRKTAIRTLTSIPQYRNSTTATAGANTCDPAMCTLKIRDSSKTSCNTTPTAVDLSARNLSKDLCYTCNGLSAGPCSTSPTPEAFNLKQFTAWSKQVSQCRNPNEVPTEETPLVNQ